MQTHFNIDLCPRAHASCLAMNPELVKIFGDCDHQAPNFDYEHYLWATVLSVWVIAPSPRRTAPTNSKFEFQLFLYIIYSHMNKFFFYIIFLSTTEENGTTPNFLFNLVASYPERIKIVKFRGLSFSQLLKLNSNQKVSWSIRLEQTVLN